MLSVCCHSLIIIIINNNNNNNNLICIASECQRLHVVGFGYVKGIWPVKNPVSFIFKGCLLGQLEEGTQLDSWLTRITWKMAVFLYVTLSDLFQFCHYWE